MYNKLFKYVEFLNKWEGSGKKRQKEVILLKLNYFYDINENKIIYKYII